MLHHTTHVCPTALQLLSLTSILTSRLLQDNARYARNQGCLVEAVQDPHCATFGSEPDPYSVVADTALTTAQYWMIQTAVYRACDLQPREPC